MQALMHAQIKAHLNVICCLILSVWFSFFWTRSTETSQVLTCGSLHSEGKDVILQSKDWWFHPQNPAIFGQDTETQIAKENFLL